MSVGIRMVSLMVVTIFFLLLLLSVSSSSSSSSSSDDNIEQNSETQMNDISDYQGDVDHYLYDDDGYDGDENWMNEIYDHGSQDDDRYDGYISDDDDDDATIYLAGSNVPNHALPTSQFTKECRSTGDPHTYTFENATGTQLHHHAQGLNVWLYYAKACSVRDHDLGFTVEVKHETWVPSKQISVVRGARMRVGNTLVVSAYKRHSLPKAGIYRDNSGNEIRVGRNGHWVIMQAVINHQVVAQLRFADFQARVQVLKTLNRATCGLCGSRLELCHGRKITPTNSMAKWQYYPNTCERRKAMDLVRSYTVGRPCPSYDDTKTICGSTGDPRSPTCENTQRRLGVPCADIYNKKCQCKNGKTPAQKNKWITECQEDATAFVDCKLYAQLKNDDPAFRENIAECQEVCESTCSSVRRRYKRSCERLYQNNCRCYKFNDKEWVGKCQKHAAAIVNCNVTQPFRQLLVRDVQDIINQCQNVCK